MMKFIFAGLIAISLNAYAKIPSGQTSDGQDIIWSGHYPDKFDCHAKGAPTVEGSNYVFHGVNCTLLFAKGHGDFDPLPLNGVGDIACVKKGSKPTLQYCIHTASNLNDLHDKYEAAGGYQDERDRSDYHESGPTPEKTSDPDSGQK